MRMGLRGRDILGAVGCAVALAGSVATGGAALAAGTAGQGITFAGSAATGAGTSANWAGYAATGGTFTAVSGTWTVPHPSPAGALSADAAWVGIGGVTTDDLIQAGTEETVLGSGEARYDAWIETLPRRSRPIPLAVRPGDSVSVSIAEQATDRWAVSIADNTTGQRYQTTVDYASSHSSAEWIEEAPSAGRRFVALDDFGTVSFSGASTTENGQALTIARAGGQAITLANRAGQALAAPSALGAGGANFSVTRTATPSTVVAPGVRRGRGVPRGRR